MKQLNITGLLAKLKQCHKVPMKTLTSVECAPNSVSFEIRKDKREARLIYYFVKALCPDKKAKVWVKDGGKLHKLIDVSPDGDIMMIESLGFQ